MDYKKLLQDRRLEMLAHLESMKESAKPVDLNDPIGRLSRMDAIQQQQMILNAKKQLEVNLQLVEAALKRVEEGTYGICQLCEEEIEAKRLLAKPEAAFCLKCQR